MKPILSIRLILGFFSMATICYGQPNNCPSEFAQMVEIIAVDYAGYKDKIHGKENEFAEHTDKLKFAASQAESFNACSKILWQYISWFKDGHLNISVTEPKTTNQVPQNASVEDFSSQKDSSKPSLELLDENTALLKIPSFNLNYKPTLDALLKQNHEKLVSTRTLIIDLRGNGGGGDSTYENLIPLFYTNPIREVGADVWASQGNIKYWDSLLQNPTLPENIKVQLRPVVAKMKEKPESFVPLAGDETIRQDKVYPFPKEVGILIDDTCASTTEQFLLAAKQSRKIKIFGSSNSAGVLDYSNVKSIELPSGWRVLKIPTSRSRRIPTDPVDPDGIAPDIKIHKTVMDHISFVRGYLSRL